MQLKTIDQNDGVTRVQLIGSLTTEGMHEIETRFQSLTSELGRPCIVDLSKVDFIGSLGMGMLVTCAQSLKQRGQKLVLLSPNEEIQASLATVGILDVIPVATDDLTAKQALET